VTVCIGEVQIMSNPQQPQDHYPYDRRREARVLRDAEDTSDYEVSRWRDMHDDFDPSVNVREYYLGENEQYGNGDGAIYSLEYLKRTGA
jgi:hypothetical protein